MELGGALWPTLTESPSEVITSFLTKEYPHQFQELRKPSCQRAPTLRWASQLFPRLTHYRDFFIFFPYGLSQDIEHSSLC